jgi:RNA polymerase sigma factor (TIGR02999 family)
MADGAGALDSDDRAPGSSRSKLGAAELVPLVYAQLRSAAERLMRSERAGHTLQATALVNEAFVSMSRDPTARWSGPREFYLAAAEAMRHLLIDCARRREADKRGGGRRRVEEIEGVLDLVREECFDDAISLHEANLRLEKQDARAAEVVRLRFFAGLSGERVAEVVGVSARQVDRDWAYARAFLLRELRSRTGGARGPGAA